MEDLTYNLDFDGETFNPVRHDADGVIKRLVKNMVEKGSNEGTVNIKINVSFGKQKVGTDEQNSRDVIVPGFTHKITSTMQIKDDINGGLSFDEMELVWDEEKNEYVIKPITGNAQMNIFDAEFTEVAPEPEEDEFTNFMPAPEIPIAELPFSDKDQDDDYEYDDGGDSF